MSVGGSSSSGSGTGSDGQSAAPPALNDSSGGLGEELSFNLGPYSQTAGSSESAADHGFQQQLSNGPLLSSDGQSNDSGEDMGSLLQRGSDQGSASSVLFYPSGAGRDGTSLNACEPSASSLAAGDREAESPSSHGLDLQAYLGTAGSRVHSPSSHDINTAAAAGASPHSAVAPSSTASQVSTEESLRMHQQNDQTSPASSTDGRKPPSDCMSGKSQASAPGIDAEPVNNPSAVPASSPVYGGANFPQGDGYHGAPTFSATAPGPVFGGPQLSETWLPRPTGESLVATMGLGGSEPTLRSYTVNSGGVMDLNNLSIVPPYNVSSGGTPMSPRDGSVGGTYESSSVISAATSESEEELWLPPPLSAQGGAQPSGLSPLTSDSAPTPRQWRISVKTPGRQDSDIHMSPGKWGASSITESEDREDGISSSCSPTVTATATGTATNGSPSPATTTPYEGASRQNSSETASPSGGSQVQPLPAELDKDALRSGLFDVVSVVLGDLKVCVLAASASPHHPAQQSD